MTKKSKLPPQNAAAKAQSLKTKSAKAATKPAASAAKSSAPAQAKSNAAPKPTAKVAVTKPVASVKSTVAKPVAATPAAKPFNKISTAKAAAALKAPKAVTAAAQPTVAPAAALRTTPAQPVAQRAMPAQGTKPADARLTAPIATKPAPAAVPAPSANDRDAKKPITTRHGFKTHELIVYPAHGVGRIIGIEEQEIAGISLELFVIEFDKDKMTLRVPTSKLASVGMRKLAEDGVMKKAMDTLKGKARIKRTMWSRRAQEYEAKINSGDLIAIAEVVRDLYRSDAQPEQSYSERQLYEAALDRMSRELAAVDKSDERSAMQRITEVLAKSAKGRRAVEDAADTADADADTEGEIKAA
jgi:CarD family transcriptional regulator